MITFTSNCIFVTIYSWKVLEHKISPIPTSISSLLKPSDVRTYMSISGPTILMLLAEWSCIEVLIFMAAAISMGAVGAMSISYTYHGLIY
mmetsp:Transcript_11662/g.15819  ORF Transcript_11662/g.15819 Transcript_11662/m.15819 type:complete len:90 (+) Transcript_11662:952-1221(+)